ncbi:MAG: 16S rRNA (cytosine1402-N4)-methyltransferase [Chloroflexi bacterium]|jgi:16S rRNA (cytosine1402-N4)-methyltransferase|nr:MAG: 16S rRNA (cytosine1402-N4)-methyltransferase [Chloroflexota bacterium]
MPLVEFDMSEHEYHKPALVNEVMSLLNIKPGDNCIDATIGDGGHAKAILDASAPNGQLLGIDADPQSILRAKKRLTSYFERTQLVNDNFSNLERISNNKFNNPVTSILIDLGLASWHFKSANRGFSFSDESDLDMRLNPNQDQSASYIVNNYSQSDLSNLIYKYGEEPKARRIANSIVENRPVETAAQLADAIQKVSPRRGKRIHPATRTFQAIRMVVNRELEVLESVLFQAERVLEKGGRLAVIAYHSLEDRIVKSFMKRESHDCLCGPEIASCICDHKAKLELLTKKVVKPSRDEILSNPNSRSARLRTCITLGTLPET